MGAAEQADLADRDRLSRGRQGRQSAERVSRSEIVGDRTFAVFLQRRARRSDSAALIWKRWARRSIPRSAQATLQSAIERLWRPDDRCFRPCMYGHGTRGLIRCFRRPVMSGAMAPTGETGHWLNGRLGGAPLDALVDGSSTDSRRRRVSMHRRLGRRRRWLCGGPADGAAGDDRAAGALPMHFDATDGRSARALSSARRRCRWRNFTEERSGVRRMTARWRGWCARRRPNCRVRSASALPMR